MYGSGFEQITSWIESHHQAPTKWRRRGEERRSQPARTQIEKRSTSDRRAGWLELVSKIIFPRGSKKS